MKRLGTLLSAVILCLVMCISLTACRSRNSDSSENESSVITEPASSAQSGSVEMKLPATAAKICGTYITENAGDLGISSPIQGGDGTLSFKIHSNDKDSVSRNARVLLHSRLISLKTAYTYINGIEMDRDLTTVTVLCDRSAYASPDESFFDYCYIPSVCCVSLEGYSEDMLKNYTLNFEFIDSENYSQISRYRYPKLEHELSSKSSSSFVVNDYQDSDYEHNDEDYYNESYDYEETYDDYYYE
ncbi:MAG: hypothetical protein Q4C42_08810 [Clostridia bacterium]|nr:hypothetical protein [Clostridia bacterium]